MGSHFSRRARRHFSSPFARVSDKRRHALVTSASSNNNNNKITSAKSGLNSTSGGESRLRAINNPSQQREQQGLADAPAAGKSASPPGSSRGQEEKEMIDQTYELNGNNFAEQTIATPSDGPIDVLHASSKQTKSWQAVSYTHLTLPTTD